MCRSAAEELARDGIQADVLDLRSIQPLDEKAILSTLEKTGSVVVVDEATPRSSVASDIAALCVDQGFDFLNTPVKRISAPHCPVPFSRPLEQAYIPSVDRIVATVRGLA
jgi:pyruvate dehydrogenase E1 component beta subunit